jgi:hypothetical protein
VRHAGGGTLLDVGCGSGRLWAFLRERFERYVGIDAVRYEGFPQEGEFIAADLDAGLPAAGADWWWRWRPSSTSRTRAPSCAAWWPPPARVGGCW